MQDKVLKFDDVKNFKSLKIYLNNILELISLSIDCKCELSFRRSDKLKENNVAGIYENNKITIYYDGILLSHFEVGKYYLIDTFFHEVQHFKFEKTPQNIYQYYIKLIEDFNINNDYNIGYEMDRRLSDEILAIKAGYSNTLELIRKSNINLDKYLINTILDLKILDEQANFNLDVLNILELVNKLVSLVNMNNLEEIEELSVFFNLDGSVRNIADTMKDERLAILIDLVPSIVYAFISSDEIRNTIDPRTLTKDEMIIIGRALKFSENRMQLIDNTTKKFNKFDSYFIQKEDEILDDFESGNKNKRQIIKKINKINYKKA